MRPLNQRERKVVAVGILVAAICGVWLLVIDPLIGGFLDRAQERDELLDRYTRNERLLAGIPIWRAQAQEQARTARTYAIAAPTRALAVEALRKRLGEVATAQGGEVAALAAVESGVPDGWVRARADLRLSMEQLYRGLVSLERGEPYVVVEYLSVGADRAADTGHLSQMDVRLEVSAPFESHARH